MFTFSVVDWKLIHVPTNHDNYKRSIRCMAIKQWRREQGFSIKAIPLYLANITGLFHTCMPKCACTCSSLFSNLPLQLFQIPSPSPLLFIITPLFTKIYSGVCLFFFHLKLDGPIFWLLQYQIIFCKNKLS